MLCQGFVHIKFAYFLFWLTNWDILYLSRASWVLEKAFATEATCLATGIVVYNVRAWGHSQATEQLWRCGGRDAAGPRGGQGHGCAASSRSSSQQRLPCEAAAAAAGCWGTQIVPKAFLLACVKYWYDHSLDGAAQGSNFHTGAPLSGFVCCVTLRVYLQETKTATK